MTGAADCRVRPGTGYPGRVTEKNQAPITDPADLPDINVPEDGDLADHRRPLLRAARMGGVGIAVLTVISLMAFLIPG